MHSARLLPPRKALVCLLISILAIPLSGCGAAAGMGYFLGIGRGRKIEPLFEIPEGKLLILVDDVDNRVTWARTRQVLARFVGEELLAHEAVDAVISNESVGKLRQIDLQFSNYSAAEIGRKLGADTVLWIEVKDFFAPGEVQDTSGAAKMAVSVKLLSCGESDPDKPRSARLWPTDGGGYLIKTELSALQVHSLKTESALATKLAQKTAVPLARLFYQHTLGDLDDDRFEE